MSKKSREIKCPHCGKWNPQDATECLICTSALPDLYQTEYEERKLTERNPIPIISIRESDPWYHKAWKWPLQIAQLIFLTVLSIIAAIASSTAH